MRLLLLVGLGLAIIGVPRHTLGPERGPVLRAGPSGLSFEEAVWTKVAGHGSFLQRNSVAVPVAQLVEELTEVRATVAVGMQSQSGRSHGSDDASGRVSGGDGGIGSYQTLILFLVGGSLLSVLVVWTLRTTVRRRTEQLTESRTRFRRLAEATSEGILLHRDGRIVDVNRAFTDMTGYTRDEIVGRSFREVLSESVREEEELSRAKKATASYETVVVRGDGSSFPAEVEERIVDVGDRPLRVVALRNVTERKRRETELLVAKEEAERMARLKSSLLNNMSHEFRTPITSILGYAELILENPDADHTRFAQNIRRSGKRLSKTLRAVLDMAQLEAESLEVTAREVDVNALVRDVVADHADRAKEKDIATEISEAESETLTTDPQLLERIVSNLVHNAVKFTPAGRVHVDVDVSESAARIAVSDTGIGIDPSFRSHLFEPFTQESDGRTRTHEGTGLGLALTKRMLDLLGGDVEVESTKGEGTTVVIRVPSLEATTERETASVEEKTT
jgi:PAS domain S-box-containing protein